jgi:hypothetical protein
MAELGQQSEEVRKRVNYIVEVIANIREANAERSSEANKENRGPLVRPSSVAKMEKLHQPPSLKASSSEMRFTLHRN